MHEFGILFLVFLALSVAVKYWLNFRHVSSVEANREQVPDAFREKISLEEHQKAADYTTTRARFARLSIVFDGLLLLVWTFGGGLEWLDQSWRSLEWTALYTGIAVILSMMLISGALDLPFSIYNTFVIEERFGFNRTTPKTFTVDLIKNTLLALIIGTPLLWVILWLMEQAGDLWWLYAWMVWTGFTLFLAWVYPTWIAPIFNKFTRLEDGPTLQRINSLLQRCGFSSNGVYVIDGSRRSSHGNAYFSGFGKNKRIVFFDTLLQSLNDDELEAVLAHELGHFKRKHIIKHMLMTMLFSLLGLALLAWLMDKPWFYSALGVSSPSTYMALLLFMLVIPVFTFLLSPLMSMLSRKNEFEADEFAAQQTRATYLIQALVNLYRENASTLTPDPVYSAFYDSHPPAPVRIAHLAEQN